MKKYFLPLALLLFTHTLKAQKMGVEPIKEDLRLLKQKILEYDPAVELYNPKFQTRADSLINHVNNDMTIYETYGAISRLCALANEGHFEVGTWQDTVHSGIVNDKDPFLPFAVHVIDRKIFIAGDFTDEGHFTKGDRVLSINGYTDVQILDKLLMHIPTDGAITTYGNKKAADNFPWFYFFYIEQAANFKVSYLPISSDNVKTITVEARTNTERKENFKRRNEKKKVAPSKSIDDFYTIKHEDTYSLLTLKSFDYRLVEDYDIKAKKFYADLFKDIQKRGVNSLVFDLRGNTGGRNEFGEDLVPFIKKDNTNTPFLIKSISWKGKEKTIPDPSSSKYRFKGGIYVLVDGYTYSTGAAVARYLKEYGKARVIGEETGTRYEGFVAGSAQYVTLPNANIRIGIPCYHKLFPPSEKQNTSNHGLIPDHIVIPDIKDVLEKKDAALALVLQLIEG